jgi:hypothetical protein
VTGLFAAAAVCLALAGVSTGDLQSNVGLFLSAMVAMVQRLDAGSFFFHPQLSVSIFSALVLKVCWNRSSCRSTSRSELLSLLRADGRSVAEPSLPFARIGWCVTIFVKAEELWTKQ